jgi:cyclophilin family peptidyl-prolyl cis-trans isomerase
VPAQEKRQRQKENARIAREARLAAERRQRRLKSIRNVGIVVALFVILIVVVNLVQGNDDKKPASATSSSTTVAATTPSTAKPVKLTGFVADPAKTYIATMKTNFGTIVLELDSKNAPKAAGRFIELARKKYYDGVDFHRVSKDFVIQGGDPSGSEAGTGSSIVGELPTDNYPVGSLAAAKKQDDPAGTYDDQYFIVTGSQGQTLPNEYARFGKVTSGLDVAQRIEALAPEGGDGRPTGKATVEKVTITES